MADVEMTDAPVVTKKKGASDAEAKKRFEVKKVSLENINTRPQPVQASGAWR